MPDKRIGKQKEKRSAIYLGPSIAGVVTHGTVFRNGLTPQLEAAVKEEPALNMLLVVPEYAAKARKDLKDETSAQGVCYKKAEEYARKRGKRA